MKPFIIILILGTIVNIKLGTLFTVQPISKKKTFDDLSSEVFVLQSGKAAVNNSKDCIKYILFARVEGKYGKACITYTLFLGFSHVQRKQRKRVYSVQAFARKCE